MEFTIVLISTVGCCSIHRPTLVESHWRSSVD